ncbi:hypothetical protein J4558_11155 [Leptolyngbya sp. 15MV]|nr:hypothetical protein J4558_11155 [Leptolyngbya sp. 15MV]
MKAMPMFAALAIGALAIPATAGGDRPTGEEKLAKMLEGRVAGEPSSCINTLRGSQLQIIDKTAIVFRDGRTLWVNRTAYPESLSSNDYLVIRHIGTRPRPVAPLSINSAAAAEQASAFAHHPFVHRLDGGRDPRTGSIDPGRVARHPLLRRT